MSVKCSLNKIEIVFFFWGGGRGGEYLNVSTAEQPQNDYAWKQLSD